MPRVLIAGGGPAAVEGLLAVRRLLPEAEVELTAPDDEFVYRPLAVSEPFGRHLPDRFSLSRIAEAAGAGCRREAMTAVYADGKQAVLASGERLPFDALLVAIGARPVEALPGSITFWGRDGDPAFRRALDAAERRSARLTFAVPHRVRWSLPLYELAMLTADHLRSRGITAGLSLVTPEAEPLAVFSGDASAELERMLIARGIELRVSTDPLEYCAGLTGDGDLSVGPEIVVSLPRLLGRGLPDLPVDDQQFLSTDEYGRVLGAPGVYAAGDVTDSPIKQGGLGAQQADSAASAIGFDLGGHPQLEAFRPTLRARVLTNGESRFMRRDLDRAGASLVSEAPLWWPGAKVFGKHLAPFLAALASLEGARSR